MAQEIFPDLYRIKIPLPDTPLKYLNSYIIKAEPRSLIVDTGLNHEMCLNAMRGGLAEIGLDLEKADIFITHLHADHFGLVGKLANDNTSVFFNRPDAEIIENWEAFPPAQMWFATGEAISHVRYLENRGLIRRMTENPVITYALADGLVREKGKSYSGEEEVTRFFGSRTSGLLS
jgi:glyoxylase-like metal-dependent hydrolase (beta-lactamase superfamily II)